MIPVIIPAYEPDRRLLLLLNDLSAKSDPVILVDDGSGDAYQDIFIQAQKLLKKNHGVLLTHNQNLGKGQALKTAFAYVLENFPDSIGVVTADSDGQHTAECILAVKEKLYACPDNLILGVRNFDYKSIPWKSQFGNKLTKKVLGYVSGIHVSDTQTGLRGIPLSFLKELILIPENRFEFETRMLLESVGKYQIIEVPIKTIYDSKMNHQTHFNPLVDSIKIYKILVAQIFKYLISSVSSCILDLVFFAFFCHILRSEEVGYIAFSTVIARIISASFNYIINYKFVFKSKENIVKAALKYWSLAAVQMVFSAVLVTIGVKFASKIPEVIIKIIVDTLLFFISYYIQHNFIFHKYK